MAEIEPPPPALPPPVDTAELDALLRKGSALDHRILVPDPASPPRTAVTALEATDEEEEEGSEEGDTETKTVVKYKPYKAPKAKSKKKLSTRHSEFELDLDSDAAAEEEEGEGEEGEGEENEGEEGDHLLPTVVGPVRKIRPKVKRMIDILTPKREMLPIELPPIAGMRKQNWMAAATQATKKKSGASLTKVSASSPTASSVNTAAAEQIMEGNVPFVTGDNAPNPFRYPPSIEEFIAKSDADRVEVNINFYIIFCDCKYFYFILRLERKLL
jgi:hypothetical protein